ncbi:unnamed protein product [Effrenium voratum]|uniref:Uncharacterized protein n=1 Tax=Effrenium voratum TaxID=2562239 RepID=A0AA36MXD0_9DINO|nr:unnamed protein product [Effrenium voratum]
MNGLATRGRRPSREGGVRECIEGRFMNHAATGRAAVGRTTKGQGSAKDLLGGYRPAAETAGAKPREPRDPRDPRHRDRVANANGANGANAKGAIAPAAAPHAAHAAHAAHAPAQRPEPPWMGRGTRRPNGEVAAVVPPWAQDTFTMPFPKREAQKRNPDNGRRKSGRALSQQAASFA